MKIKLGIVDRNKNYVRRLIDYFTSHYLDEIEISAFSDVERLKDHLETQRLDVILADEELVPDTEFSSKSVMLAYFSDSVDIRAIRGVRAVCKYQKAEQIYREILNLYAELDRQASYKMSANTSPIFLFMGASGGSGTTTAAAACAISLARSDKKVLYMNLEENGCIGHIFKGEGQMSLSDVLYAVKSDNSNLYLKMESMVQKDNSGVYFYTPFRITLDASEMNADDLTQILSVLTKYGAYNAIVVDADALISDKRAELMKAASLIFLVAQDHEASKEKLKRRLNELRILEESSDDVRIMNRINVLYNQMRTGGVPGSTEYNENVFGAIGMINSGSSRKVAEEIVRRGTFDKLFK